MNKLLIVLIVVILLFGTGFYYLRNRKQNSFVRPSPTQSVSYSPTPIIQTTYCKPQDLNALIQTQGAAGSIYGTISLKNNSNKLCHVLGNNFIEPEFTATNIVVKQQSQAGQQIIELSPNQTVYSQVRFQNGPQCQSPIKQTNIMLQYKISPTDFAVVKNETGGTNQTIVVCSDTSEQTEIDVWSISTNPANQ